MALLPRRVAGDMVSLAMSYLDLAWFGRRKMFPLIELHDEVQTIRAWEPKRKKWWWRWIGRLVTR